VIAIGYGADKGKMHKSKSLDSVIRCEGNPPLWFTKGAEAALLAPTAMNQQKFRFTLSGDDKVKAEALFGPYSAIDLGIVKYHFEIGAGRENFHWA
ncbi:MAG: nitroreductase family protein, partial [Bullifex sp.]|nr:nitroreductase family protein [Bullifex sp.]